MTIRIGSRGSKLAKWQAKFVENAIRKNLPGVDVEIHFIKTKGDKILDSPLSQIGGKGLFVKEIEEALLRGEIDLAVHSLKDVPAELPEGLLIAAYMEREDPRDVLISIDNISFEDIPKGGRVGSSSLRRCAQLKAIRPDLQFVPIRGNVETRLRKLKEEGLSCIILAAAGLKRLNLQNKVSYYFSENEVIPAVGQGCLAIEMREDDPLREELSFLNHKETELAVMAERGFLQRLEGGCQVPLAAHAVLKEGQIYLTGFISDIEGRNLLKEDITGSYENAWALGEELAELLKAKGGDEILKEIYEK